MGYVMRRFLGAMILLSMAITPYTIPPVQAEEAIGYKHSSDEVARRGYRHRGHSHFFHYYYRPYHHRPYYRHHRYYRPYTPRHYYFRPYHAPRHRGYYHGPGYRYQSSGGFYFGR